MQTISAVNVSAVSERERLECLKRDLLARARRAREDPLEFVDFVLRNERNERVKSTPHQHLLVEFALKAETVSGIKGKAVLICPIGHAKSFTVTVALTAWQIGRNPNINAGIVSATSNQASKFLNAIRTLIECSPEYRLVFPEIRRSNKAGDPWTQTSFTVERTGGGKDPTLQAFGLNSKSIAGSRLGWIICDDLLNQENTRTPEARQQLLEFFNKYVLSRLEPRGGHCVVVNSAIAPEDLLHYLESKLGWPTMRMDAYGPIYFNNTPFGNEEQPGADLVEPLDVGSDACVIAGLRELPEDKQVLFPAKFSKSILNEISEITLPMVFAANFRSICRDDESSFCREEYIERSKENGRRINLFDTSAGKVIDLPDSFDAAYQFTGAHPIFIGVDLAVKKGEDRDCTAIVVVELRDLPELRIRNARIVLDAEFGQYPAPEIVRRIARKYAQFGGIVIVEDNGAQAYLRQIMVETNTDIPVRPYNTTKKKWSYEHGIPALFLEMSQGAWVLPNAKSPPHLMRKGVTELVKQCLFYRPSEHVGDLLMATFFAREHCRRWAAAKDAAGQNTGSLVSAIMSR